ncbi:MAG: radical SAM protein [Firmicutes bacterium]|nr:radical SAM protein [Bacillota bacterium]MBQ6296012.1 radical SAM protein [Bacillota bacterium]
MAIAKIVQSVVVKEMLAFLEKDPENNIEKVINLLEKFDRRGRIERHLKAVKPALSDPDSNWRKLVLKLYSDVDEGVRKKVFENFVLNATIIGGDMQADNEAKYGCNIPWAILLDPTSACNKHCVGCWAAEYGNQLNLSYEEMSSIVSQGKALGTYMYLFTGGEPLVRKKDIIKLCEEHDDCVFTAFTNGSLLDEEFAQEMLRVKNFVPAFSIEGFEEATDSRRGEGTYQEVLKAMEILKRNRLPFGISCCYTSANVDVIGSEAYFDKMIDMGAYFAWFFTYMPIGKKAVPELMATAEQREFMYHRVREFRKTKPLFTIDFWNDGEYVKGCIAGGRAYLHINANGDIEPCAFIHYSDSNIREKTLLEAYQSPLFMGYRHNQPFNDNMLRPCPVLDNPGYLTKIVEESGAESTDYSDKETAKEYSDKCVHVAERWKPVSEKLWVESGHEL